MCRVKFVALRFLWNGLTLKVHTDVVDSKYGVRETVHLINDDDVGLHLVVDKEVEEFRLTREVGKPVCPILL